MLPVFIILGIATIIYTVEVYLFNIFYWPFRPKYVKRSYFEHTWSQVVNFASHIFEL